MDMPIRSFWALVGNIHKVEADEDRRALRVAASARKPESAKLLFEEFDDRLKGVVVVDVPSPMAAQPDRQGINELKGLLGKIE